MEQLVVSSHEFSFLFTLFLKSFFKSLYHVFIFIFHLLLPPLPFVFVSFPFVSFET